jgi:hypothetical protein
MKSKNLIGVGLLVGTFFASRPASAQFQLFDNFNSYANGQLVGQGGWTGTINPTSSQVVNGGAFLGNFATASPTFRALGGSSILNSSSAATVFLQFTLGSVATPPAAGNNFNFIITDQATPPDTAGSSEVQFNMDSTQSYFRARNGAAFVNLSADGVSVYTPSAGVTYDLWFEINNTTDTYRVFLSGGSLLTRTLMSSAGNSVFTFRNSGAGAQPNDLITFNTGNGGSGNVGGPTIDNIYVDINGFNPIDPAPVPEPGTVSLLALAGAAFAYFRRSRRK